MHGSKIEFLKNMRASASIVRDALDYIEPYINIGITTGYLDKLIEHFIRDRGAIPAPLQKGFPRASCISKNHIICHGIPDESDVLVDGDILNIDISVDYNGYYGDASRMYSVGKISKIAQNLIDTTHRCLMSAIDVCIVGGFIGDIGATIESIAHKKSYSVVREYTGHGIGDSLHMDPVVRHYGKHGSGEMIVEGMCFTIEPMINAGQRHSRLLDDGWTVITRDMSLSAQWEHTVYISHNGPIILTQ